MRRTAILAVIGVVFCGLGGGGFWYYYTGTPQYSLRQLGKAVRGKDYETARYFVDEERMSETISKSVVDTLMTQVTKKMEADRNPFSGFGVAMIEMMAPKLREMAKDQVKDSIKHALSGEDSLTSKNGSKKADLKLFSKLRIKDSAVSGNTAEILVDGIPQPNAFDLKEIRLRMARIPNSRDWRVEEIPDLGDAFAKFMDENSLDNTATRPSSNEAQSATSASTEWTLVESTDKMDNAPIVILRKSGSGGANMTIRCARRKTEAYVDTDKVLNNGDIRIKFDEFPPIRQTWGKSTDDQALFVPDAITFARQLTQSKTFLLEFTPFQEAPRTISFDVTNLGDKLKKVSDACNWEAVDRSRAQAKIEDAHLRAHLLQYVHPCADQDIGRWCWSDPNDPLFSNDSGFSETKESALADAVRSARSGLAFKNTKRLEANCAENDCTTEN